MPTTNDGASVEISLDDTQSVSGQRADGWLEVETSNAESVHIHIDDGTTGNQPSQYTLEVQCYKPQHSDWMFDDKYTTSTARSWSLTAVNKRMRFDITNTSGNNSEIYRVTIESIRGEF